METPVELLKVEKSFGGQKILQGVDLSVRSGETFVIIGRSGSGKSVTLRHIVGLAAPDRGHVRVLGKDLQLLSKPELAQLRLEIGFLFQSGALLNWMTIQDNVKIWDVLQSRYPRTSPKVPPGPRRSIWHVL